MSVDGPTRWKAATVMVTGATGFLGAHLVRALGAHGADVVAVSRGSVSAPGAGARWMQADLTDFAQVRRLFTNCRPDCVFHLSSLADGRPDLLLVVPIMQADVIATVHVLTVAAELGLRRLVLPGSLEEPEPGAAPTSPYAAAKATSRLYARMFHLLYAVPVVTARIFMTYGPGQPAWKLIPSTANSLLRGIPPHIGSPVRQVDWVYISDVINGLLRLAEVANIEGQTIDLGSGTLTTIREVVETLRELSGAPVNPVFAAVPKRPFERVARADVEATWRILGWKPEVSLRDGLARTLEALRR